MAIKSTKSSSRYGLTVILILALFVVATFFYAKNYRINDLSNKVSQLHSLETDFSALDTCVLILYRVDNNGRLFEATGNNSYMKMYSSEIARLSGILDSLKTNDKAQDSQIKSLIVRKKAKMDAYLKLERLTDSLILKSAAIDTLKERVFARGFELVKGNFKTMVTIDTLKPKQEEAKQKGLFGRLAAAISKKKFKKDSSVVLVKKEITLDTSLSSRNYNLLQLQNINSYFRNLYSKRKLLNDREIEILHINSRIINEIVLLLQNFKQNEATFEANVKSNIHNNLEQTFENISNIYTFIFVLLVLLVAVILFNLWIIYKNENKLIDYGQKASQYAQSKSRFLANMSHEIRTPLNSVIGFSEQLSQENLSIQQKQQVEAIKASSEILLDLVNDILDFSKYEIGKINFDKVAFVPFNVINEVINSIAIQASRKGINLERQFSFDDSLVIQGDSLRLKQLVMNLLSNAIKFTDTGDVVLRADMLNNSKNACVLRVQVIDTGIGIEEKDVSLIFDEFAQVDYSITKNSEKGTGLGLAICKKIVELQHGNISVISKIGEGSNFTFEIPYEVCENRSMNKTALITTDVDILVGKRALLVDDNKMNVMLAQTVLQRYQMLIDTASDGAEAYELFKNHDYDLLLTDVQMPVMSGLELTRKVRSSSDELKAHLPILGITANVIEEDRVRYLAAGMNDLVLKPYSEKELVNKIVSFVKK
jgi:signal transduction histidine kinase